MATYTVDLGRGDEVVSTKVEADNPSHALNQAYLEAGGGTWRAAVVCDADGDLAMEAMDLVPAAASGTKRQD